MNSKEVSFPIFGFCSQFLEAKGIQQAGHKNADTLQNTIQTIQGEYKGKITVLTSERDDLAAKLQVCPCLKSCLYRAFALTTCQVFCFLL